MTSKERKKIIRSQNLSNWKYLSIFWPPQSKLALVPQASSVDSDVDSIITAKKTQIKQNLSLRETGEVAN